MNGEGNKIVSVSLPLRFLSADGRKGPVPPMQYLPRGVHYARALSRNGHPLLVAIDNDHRWIDWREVPPDANAYQLLDELYAALDAADPDHARRKAPRDGVIAVALLLLDLLPYVPL